MTDKPKIENLSDVLALMDVDQVVVDCKPTDPCDPKNVLNTIRWSIHHAIESRPSKQFWLTCPLKSHSVERIKDAMMSDRLSIGIAGDFGISEDEIWEFLKWCVKRRLWQCYVLDPGEAVSEK